MFRRIQHTVGIAPLLALALVALAALPGAVPAAAQTGLKLSRATAAPGDTVTSIGSGFHAGATATVTVDFMAGGVSEQFRGTSQVNQNGSFVVPFDVPAGTTPGSYRVTARDSSGAAAHQDLVILPLLDLQVGTIAPRVTVVANHDFYVRGRSGFQPGETVTVSVTFPLYNGAATTETRTPTASTTGGFGEVLLHVPASARQDAVTVTAVGGVRAELATGAIQIVYQPSLSVQPHTVAPGGAATIHGSGFIANSTVAIAASISQSGAAPHPVHQDVTTNQNGAFDAQITIPVNAQLGTFPITVVATAADVHASTRLAIEVHPALSVSPATVSPGQTVTVSGKDFSIGVDVSVRAVFPLPNGNNQTVPVTTHTNGQGAFTTQLQVPGRASAGTVTVIAGGLHGQAHASLTVQAARATSNSRPGLGCGDKNHKHTGSPGNSGKSCHRTHHGKHGNRGHHGGHH